MCVDLKNSKLIKLIKRCKAVTAEKKNLLWSLSKFQNVSIVVNKMLPSYGLYTRLENFMYLIMLLYISVYFFFQTFCPHAFTKLLEHYSFDCTITAGYSRGSVS